MADLSAKKADMIVKLVGRSQLYNVDVEEDQNGDSRILVQSGRSHVSSINSSSTTLLASGVFVGTYKEILDFSQISVNVGSNVSGTLYIEWSIDGVTKDSEDVFQISANSYKQYTFGCVTQYFRVRYVNGAVNQSTFRLQTIFHPMGRKASSHRANDNIVDDDDAELMKSIITGKTELGTYTNVRVDTLGRLITTAELSSPLPALKVLQKALIQPLLGTYITQVISQKTALKEFHIGGRVPCEGTIAKYDGTIMSFIPGGNFESSGDVGMWTNTGVGDSDAAHASYSFSTDQAKTGSGSAKFTFTKSDQNHYMELTYTWTTPQDLSVWRYVEAWFFNSLNVDHKFRTISIILTSGASKRFYSVSGYRDEPPFNLAQWIQIFKEIEKPNSVSGSNFDINNVNSFSLRMQDENNRNGVIYWDTARLSGQITNVDKIYTSGNTNQLIFDPVLVFETGETLLLLIRNNSSTISGEIQIEASGVNV